LFFDGPERGRRLSRYWLLLPLAAVIASAGVVSDSTATVIGAMFMAPLMTPILEIVLADGANLRRCVLPVVAGAAGSPPHRGPGGRPGDRGGRFGRPGPVRYLRHLARRGHRHLTGAAAGRGRADPGVRRPRQSLGAFLLFVTNVAAILATGIVVMSSHRVHRVFGAASSRYGGAIAVIAALLLMVIVPLRITRPDTHRGHRAEPAPSLTLLRRDLNAASLDGLDVRVNLVPASYQPVPK
jgi:hypothetical protein